MAARKNKFYVVWKGTTPGVYMTWAQCAAAIKGFSNAKHKSFPSLKSAEKAFREGPDAYWGTHKFVSPLSDAALDAIGQPMTNSMCVDAACDTTTKIMEYRGVWYHDKSIAFQQGPFQKATNNIGEFLAIVHALALMAKQLIDWPVYSDSQTAISWVRNKSVRSTSMQLGKTSEDINNLVARSLRWLNDNEYNNAVLKWKTEAWGEVPADYGRK